MIFHPSLVPCFHSTVINSPPQTKGNYKVYENRQTWKFGLYWNWCKRVKLIIKLWQFDCCCIPFLVLSRKRLFHLEELTLWVLTEHSPDLFSDPTRNNSFTEVLVSLNFASPKLPQPQTSPRHPRFGLNCPFQRNQACMPIPLPGFTKSNKATAGFEVFLRRKMSFLHMLLSWKLHLTFLYQ